MLYLFGGVGMRSYGKKIKKDNMILAGLILVITVVMAVYIIKTGDGKIVFKGGEKSFRVENTLKPPKEAQTEIEKVEDAIKVYVVGEVRNPGVVEIPKGGIILDAVTLAGGFTEDAAKENINLVYELFENAMIRIKAKEEIKGSDENNRIESFQENRIGVEIISNSQGVVVNDQDNQSLKKVNINRAAKEELLSLPGIGEAYATRIIEYRNLNGSFRNKEDIKNVSGIGISTYERIKDMITLN
jgi:competence protein ComEA